MDGIRNLFRKKLEDGDLSPEIISQIESMAATGADASTISALVGVSEEQVNNVLMSGSTSEVMPVEGEEMVETAEVTEDPMLNLFQQNNSLNNDQAITTLFAQQEPQGIMAAKGGRIPQLVRNNPDGSRPGYGGPQDRGDEARGTGGYSGSGDTGDLGSEKANVAATKSAVTNLGMDNIDRARANQYKNLPTPTVTVGVDKFDNPINIKTTYTEKAKRAANLDALNAKGISSFDPRVNKIGINPFGFNFAPTQKKQRFNLLDVVLFVGSSGLINPEVTKVAKAISSINKVSGLVSDTTKTKGVKETVKDVLTSTAKKEISKKTGIDVKTIDTTLDTIQKALDTDLGKSVVDKFNSLNTTNKNTTNKNTTNKTTTFNGGDNDGPLPNIIPVVPELIAEEVIVEEPETSLFSMSNLNRIRDRQNRRRSFFANRGGLAGLFRVKNQ